MFELFIISKLNEIYIFLLFYPYKHNFTIISRYLNGIKNFKKNIFVTFLFFKIINLNYEISFKI